MNINFSFINLANKVLAILFHIMLKPNMFCIVHLTAKFIAFFKQNNLMATFCSRNSCHHTCRAATYNPNFLMILWFWEVVLAHCITMQWVYRTFDTTSNCWEISQIVSNVMFTYSTFAPSKIHAAEAFNARANVFCPTGTSLISPIVVSNQFTRHKDVVRFSFS